MFRLCCHYIFPSRDLCLSFISPLVPFINLLRHIFKGCHNKKDIWSEVQKIWDLNTTFIVFVVVKVNGNDIQFQMGKAGLHFYINLHISLFSVALKMCFLIEEKYFLDSHLVPSIQVYKWALSKILLKKKKSYLICPTFGVPDTQQWVSSSSLWSTILLKMQFIIEVIWFF